MDGLPWFGSIWALIAGIYFTLRLLKEFIKPTKPVENEYTPATTVHTAVFFIAAVVLRIPMMIMLAALDVIHPVFIVIFAFPVLAADGYALLWGYRLAKQRLFLQSVPLYAPFVVDFFALYWKFH